MSFVLWKLPALEATDAAEGGPWYTSHGQKSGDGAGTQVQPLAFSLPQHTPASPHDPHLPQVNIICYSF